MTTLTERERDLARMALLMLWSEIDTRVLDLEQRDAPDTELGQARAAWAEVHALITKLTPTE